MDENKISSNLIWKFRFYVIKHIKTAKKILKICFKAFFIPIYGHNFAPAKVQ